MIINEGMIVFLNLTNTDIDRGELGTGNSAISASDTDLDTPTGSTLLTLTSKVSSNDTPLMITKIYTLPSSGDNNTYHEFGLKHNATSTLYNRILFTGFLKDQTEEIPVISAIKLVNNL